MNRRGFLRGCVAAATCVLTRAWSPASIPSGKVFEQVHVEASTRVWMHMNAYWDAQLAADRAIGIVVALIDPKHDVDVGDHVSIGDQRVGRVFMIDRGG